MAAAKVGGQQRTQILQKASIGAHLLRVIAGQAAAYTLAKRPEEAIRLYELTQKRLKQELEIEPSLELFEAFQRARLAA